MPIFFFTRSSRLSGGSPNSGFYVLPEDDRTGRTGILSFHLDVKLVTSSQSFLAPGRVRPPARQGRQVQGFEASSPTSRGLRIPPNPCHFRRRLQILAKQRSVCRGMNTYRFLSYRRRSVVLLQPLVAVRTSKVTPELFSQHIRNSFMNSKVSPRLTGWF